MSPRAQLFGEALHSSEVVRMAARSVLKYLVEVGRDVTDPEFVPSDVEMPSFGSLGMHMLGWPECIIVPPYEDQAQRVLNRLEELRGRIPRYRDFWFRDVAAAVAAFHTHGELPPDDLLRKHVVTLGEFYALMANACGRGDPARIEAFGRVATAEGEQRHAALKQLAIVVVNAGRRSDA
ncbi:MAG TPA: hypothetical protein VF128_11465 [Gemmatimonadaceae bacterium]